MELPSHERGALDGMIVIDFGQFIAGPLASRILGDHGARVIHIDPPGGLRWKSPANKTLNRGKEMLTLDLKTKEGRKKALELIEIADVVVENFSPGTMTKLNLDPLTLHSHNPRAIFLSLPAFSSTDPSPDLPNKAYEDIILAHVGVFSDMGLNRKLMGVNPSYSPLPLASTYGAIVGAGAVVMALFSRERTGKGDIIECPLAASLADCLIYNSMKIDHLPERYKCLREREIERREREKETKGLGYEQVKNLLDPFYCTYMCGDGRPLYIVAPCHAIHQRRVLEALGIWNDMMAMGLPQGNVYLPSDKWGEDKHCLLGTYPLTDVKWISILKERMKAAFLTRSAKDWETILGAMRVPIAATLTSQEWLHSDHAQGSKLVIKVKDEEYGEMLQPGHVVWLERANVPQSKKEREEVMKKEKQKWKKKEEDEREGEEGGGTKWLEGVNVVDFCDVIAGPQIGGTMAKYGANVIKVDPVKPKYDPLVTVFMGMPINRNKRSLLLDLKQNSNQKKGNEDEAKEVVRRLIEWADVVLINKTRRQLETLGLGEEGVKKINPSAILCVFDAFGGPGWGRRSDEIGYDDVLQAMTGIMARFGGGLETPEEHAHLGTIDVVSGFAGALSTGLALLKRWRTGKCDVARTSLAACAQTIQINVLYDYEGRGDFDEPSGPYTKGWHCLKRWYQTKDKWVFLDTNLQKNEVGDPNNSSFTTLFSSLSLAFPPLQIIDFLNYKTEEGEKGREGILEEFERKLEELLGEMEGEEVIRKMRRIEGVGVQEMKTMNDLRERNISKVKDFGGRKERTGRWGKGEVEEDEGRTFHFMVEEGHPIGCGVTMFSPCSVRSKNCTITTPPPSPQYGTHTTQVLNQMGYSEGEIEGMMERGVVGKEWGGGYLPGGGDPWLYDEGKYKEFIHEAEREVGGCLGGK